MSYIKKQCPVCQKTHHNFRYCSITCYNTTRLNDLENKKNEMLDLYKKGINIRKIAKQFGFEYPRLMYNFRRWGVEIRPAYTYKDIMMHIGSLKTAEAQQRFLDGTMSYRASHKMASKLWGITKQPCISCGWDKAERDMHLIIPKLLKKENAISLCPNCHRLVHRKILNPAEMKNYQPERIGVANCHLDGERHDIHISI